MNTIYEFCEFSYQQGRGLTKNNMKIPLEPLVEKLLVLLLEANGQSITKASVADKLWPGGAPSDSSIDRCAYLLRKALSQLRGRSLLVTAYGRGVRIDATILKLRASSSQFISAVASASDPAAYELYRVGIELTGKRTRREFDLGMNAFRAATELDPTYAAAWAGQAYIQIMKSQRFRCDVEESRRIIDTTSQRALEIWPGMTTALAARAWMIGVLDWRLGEAISMLDLALAEEGEDWVPLSIRGWMNVGAGHLSLALADFERAMKVSPLEPDTLAPYAWVLLCSCGAGEALSFAETTLQKRPDRPGLLLILATAALFVGDTKRALAAMSQAIDLTHRQPIALAVAAWIYASLDRRQKAIELIAEGEASPDQKPPLSMIVPAYLALGDHAHARRLIEQAASEREPGIFFASVNPRLVALRQQIQEVVRPLRESACNAIL